MRPQLLNTALAQTVAWIWLGILAAGGVCWLVLRYWRRRHPLPHSLPEPSYSERLEQRLMRRRGAAKRKRRDGSTQSHRHPH